MSVQIKKNTNNDMSGTYGHHHSSNIIQGDNSSINKTEQNGNLLQIQRESVPEFTDEDSDVADVEMAQLSQLDLNVNQNVIDSASLDKTKEIGYKKDIHAQNEANEQELKIDGDMKVCQSKQNYHGQTNCHSKQDTFEDGQWLKQWQTMLDQQDERTKQVMDSFPINGGDFGLSDDGCYLSQTKQFEIMPGIMSMKLDSNVFKSQSAIQTIVDGLFGSTSAMDGNDECKTDKSVQTNKIVSDAVQLGMISKMDLMTNTDGRYKRETMEERQQFKRGVVLEEDDKSREWHNRRSSRK